MYIVDYESARKPFLAEPKPIEIWEITPYLCERAADYEKIKRFFVKTNEDEADNGAKDYM